jgi:hypothetical protein
MSEQVFTVFDSSEWGWQDSDEEIGQTVEEIIAWYVSCGYKPIAWCEGSAYGNVQKLRTESIAAGRLIDCVDGKYIPRIPSCPADATEQAEIDAAKCQPAHVSHVEPERAELPYFRQRTKFDPFGPGYEVFSDAVSSGFMPAQPKAPLHPLQKMNEGGNALHGSAWLLKD